MSGGAGCRKIKTEEMLLQNYEEFFGLIQYFGMGMVIFPSLINELKGTYSITKQGEALDSSIDGKSVNSGASPSLPPSSLRGD